MSYTSETLYHEIVEIASKNEIDPNELIKTLSLLCINSIKAIKNDTEWDGDEVTVTFDDGDVAKFTLGENV